MSVPSLVDHLVARDGVPARSGLAYDYILAGDGLFLAAENDLLTVRVPVARCTVRGLPPVYPACTLMHGRLPVHLWHEMVRLARGVAALGREVLFVVVLDPADAADAADAAATYRLDVPDQIAGAARVAYRPPAPGSRVVLELHSHHTLPARFSHTDDADEQRLCLYGVIGRLDRRRAEVALRAGAYGHYLPLPWESVFDGTGDERAGVHDGQFDGLYGDPAGASAGQGDAGDDTGDDTGDDAGSGTAGDGRRLAEGGLYAEAEAFDDHAGHADHARLTRGDRCGPAPRRLSLWHELRG